MRSPVRYPKLTWENVEPFRKMERDFHIRAFGEELATVNLDMTKEERIGYIQWMRDNARKHGVNMDRPLPYNINEDELDS